MEMEALTLPKNLLDGPQPVLVRLLSLCTLAFLPSIFIDFYFPSVHVYFSSAFLLSINNKDMKDRIEVLPDILIQGTKIYESWNNITY